MIEKIPFGRTGHASSRTIFGAAALSKITQEEADQTMELVLSRGVNHIDTAASYGEAEDRLKPWMKSYRNEFFLATKTEKRTYQESYDQICRSLERLGVDHVDHLQIHALHTEEEWQQVFSANGALRACVQARDEGMTRFISVTGHGLEVPKFHLRSLHEFDFDSILLPYNYLMSKNAQYMADFEEVVNLAESRGIAVQTIKSLLRRPWQEGPQSAATWYEPLSDQKAVEKAMHWVLGRPGVFLCTAGDIHLLPMVLDAAERFKARPSDAEMDALLQEQEMAPLFT